MKIILWLVIVGALFFLYVRYVERHNIYFPFKEIQSTPEVIGLGYEDVYFETGDGKRLHGWFIPRGEAKFTFLFAHGNAGNIGHRLEKLAVFNDMGFNVFIFDYRGYGKSEGAPSEAGLYRDAGAAYNYLIEKRDIAEGNIIFYGESLGGAVLIDLATEKKPGALITEEAFTSVSDMARIVYPFVPTFMISSKFDSLSKIKNVAAPKLIIHSVDDEIVLFRLGEKLFSAAAPPKEMLKIRGSHNTAFFDSVKEVRGGIEDFFGKIFIQE
jgi:fermentation-respiration switch protein FrsA (DUF1100 family)